MATTFQSREAVRDELVTLFTNKGSWQSVYGYQPSVNEVSGKTPFLIIRAAGTSQNMEGVFTNPAQYQFVLSSYVLAYSESGGWTSSQAEDKLDELDKVLRQVIRDNTGNLTNADVMSFDGNFSDIQNTIIEGLPYMVEFHTIIVSLPNGAV